MKNIPRILPLAGVAIGGVLALNALAGAKSLPTMLSGARAWAEETAKAAVPGGKEAGAATAGRLGGVSRSSNAERSSGAVGLLSDIYDPQPNRNNGGEHNRRTRQRTSGPRPFSRGPLDSADHQIVTLPVLAALMIASTAAFT